DRFQHVESGRCLTSQFFANNACRGERGREAAADGVQPLALAECSPANANDRLPRASLGRVEGGDGIVEGRDGADVRPQSFVPHPLDDLAQLGTIGLDNEVDRQTVGGACPLPPPPRTPAPPLPAPGAPTAPFPPVAPRAS